MFINVFGQKKSVLVVMPMNCNYIDVHQYVKPFKKHIGREREGG